MVQKIASLLKIGNQQVERIARTIFSAIADIAISTSGRDLALLQFKISPTGRDDSYYWSFT